MNWTDIASSQWGPKLVRALCGVLPRTQAYQIGYRLTSFAARQKGRPLVRALRSNMAVVHGWPEDHPVLERTIKLLFGNLVGMSISSRQ
jgi:hypothetical protein